ncbi:MAG: M23 family metallopeptidase [Balneolaceae bacterium]
MLHKGRTLFTLWLLSTISFLSAGTAYAQDLSSLTDTTSYLWPTDAGNYLSSTFAETRSAHFHSGIDIKTWGQEGYRVFATKDGTLHRLGISPFGYGKVIYLKHEDGSYSVYAHLNRFESFIQQIADSLRLPDYRSDLDQIVDDLNIRVRQGDVIAYTGSTGIGPPHLHFEIRTPENEAVNPLLTNMVIRDQLSPVFSSLAIAHLELPELHTGEIETRRPSDRSGVYDFGTIRTNGPVGLAVDTYDRANQTPNVYAVYSLTMVQNGDTLFHSRADHFPMASSTGMLVDRVYTLLRNQRRGFQRLYIVNGNDLPIYHNTRQRGILDLPEGDHPIQIIAADYYGNESTARLTLRVADRTAPPLADIRSVPAYQKPAAPDNDREPLSEFVNKIESRQIEPVYFTTTSSAGIRQTSNLVQAPIRLTRETESKTLFKKLIPGRRQIIHLPDQTFWVEIPADALYDTLDLQITIREQDGLPTLAFSPEMVPLKGQISVNLILPPDSDYQTTGLYAYHPRQNRYHLLSTSSNTRLLRAELTELQPLAVRRDDTSPTLGTPRIRTVLGGEQVLALPVRDSESGIDHRSSEIAVNGKRGIVEYNPDRSELIYYLPGFTPLRDNEITARVYDLAGNLTEDTFHLLR